MRHLLGDAFSLDRTAGANIAGAFTPALKYDQRPLTIQSSGGEEVKSEAGDRSFNT